ncbi:YlbL family protein [Georgenia thermotolerans]|uniref:PDZ domain-containing protein n=1 Tax=Georgenia thermotolerans TaxID=527326 RepID=A0A7J5UP11_9MICO|nr:S16 family serine protease [Georgenia thermotolerans]KAE8764125.1 PDZ domain-containing protein [Georgenia thermotolerans]
MLPGRRTADRRGPVPLAAGGATRHGAEPAPEHAADEAFVSRRSVTLVASGALLAVLILIAVVVPLPYAIERPGPTVNTLSEVDGKPLITVDGAPTYPTSGELRLTTVSVSGGPGYPVTAADVVAGWLSGSEVVLPREAIFPEGSTRQSVDEQAGAQMTSSQTNATVAALEELGHKVPMVLTVQEAAKGSAAQGVLLAGDVITSVQPAGGPRTEVESFSDLAHVLAATAPGTTVAVGIERDGQARTVDVATMAPPADRSAGDDAATPGGSLLGVVLKPDVQMPVDVHFDIDKIGGPSAGTMFALGIIDVLTPGEMTGGKDIAGTGTMNLAGEVGPIGGIQQKLLGARRDGAEWFLAPRANCNEVRGHVPDGLHVVSVTTLAEAHHAVETIGAGDGASLPTCAA